MEKYSWISVFLLLTSLPSFAQMQLRFYGEQARQLWYLLDEAKKSGGNIVSEGTMGHSHLSSPIINCHRANPDDFSAPKFEQDPSLYSCSITLGIDTVKKQY